MLADDHEQTAHQQRMGRFDMTSTTGGQRQLAARSR
jgi:hypothetical protein